LIDADRISVTIERGGRAVKKVVADLGTTLIADIRRLIQQRSFPDNF
jgi:hypothetical protein